jgi:hypothetical protein
MEDSVKVKVSFGAAERTALKRQLTGDRFYADRISLNFAFQLALAEARLREARYILDVIDGLENVRPRVRMRKESQFKHAPLHPFWHVHWSAPRHFLPNIGIHWNLEGIGTRDALTPMLQDVAEKCGSDSARWPGIVAHRLVVEGYRDRARRGLTGDWIVFGKHGGLNYYLALATHEEGKGSNAIQLHRKLQQGSAAEFPFLFEKQRFENRN